MYLHLRTGPNPQRGLDFIPNSVPRTEALSSLLSTRERTLYPSLLVLSGRAEDLLGFHTAILDYFRKERDQRSKQQASCLRRWQCLSGNASGCQGPPGGFNTPQNYGVRSAQCFLLRPTSISFAKLAPTLYDPNGEPAMRAGSSSDTVSFQEFYKLVRPTFHGDFDVEGLLAVCKRSCVVAFTQIGIYIRTPSTSRDPVPRHAWPHRDFGMF